MDTYYGILAPLTELLKAVVPVLLPVVAAWIGKYGYLWWQAQPEQRQELYAAVARSAVYAAEQVGKTQLGSEKKQWAMAIAQDRLDEYGVGVRAHELSAMIEAAVYQHLNQVPTRPLRG